MTRWLDLGPFRIDTETKLLLRDGVPVALGPRAIAVLQALVARAGSPVSKEELFRAAWPDLRSVNHGAHSGHHGAAEQRCDVERQAGVDHHHRATVDHGVLGIARHARLMVHRLAGVTEAMMTAQQLPRRARRQRALADIGPAFQAAPAAAAAHVEGEADVVARLDVVHARAVLEHVPRRDEHLREPRCVCGVDETGHGMRCDEHRRLRRRGQRR